MGGKESTNAPIPMKTDCIKVTILSQPTITATILPIHAGNESFILMRALEYIKTFSINC